MTRTPSALFLALAISATLAPAAMAGGVRDVVPTRLTTIPPPRVTPVVVHELYVAPSLFVVPGQLLVNCFGMTTGPGVVMSSPGGHFRALPAFPASATIVAQRGY